MMRVSFSLLSSLSLSVSDAEVLPLDDLWLLALIAHLVAVQHPMKLHLDCDMPVGCDSASRSDCSDGCETSMHCVCPGVSSCE